MTPKAELASGIDNPHSERLTPTSSHDEPESDERGSMMNLLEVDSDGDVISVTLEPHPSTGRTKYGSRVASAKDPKPSHTQVRSDHGNLRAGTRRGYDKHIRPFVEAEEAASLTSTKVGNQRCAKSSVVELRESHARLSTHDSACTWSFELDISSLTDHPHHCCHSDGEKGRNRIVELRVSVPFNTSPTMKPNAAKTPGPSVAKLTTDTMQVLKRYETQVRVAELAAKRMEHKRTMLTMEKLANNIVLLHYGMVGVGVVLIMVALFLLYPKAVGSSHPLLGS